MVRSLAVSILNWNHTEDTLRCAQTLSDWKQPPAIYIADNASTDKPAALFHSQLPQAQVLQNLNNLGFGGGNNVVLQACLTEWQTRQHSDYVLLLNNDAYLAEATVEAMLIEMENTPSVAMLGTAIQDTVAQGEHANTISYGGRDVLKYFDTRERQQYQNKLCNVYYVPATAAIMRMKAIEQVGLFDTDYFFGMEAADWCVRAREADWLTAILPNLTVTHHVERTGDVRNTLHAYYSVRNRFLFIRKRCKTNKAAWTLRWVWRTSLAATDALRRAQPMRARALWAALSDGLHNRGGPAPVWIR